MSKKTIALTGGSTGGHIFPLVSLYNYLNEGNKYKFMWFGEQSSLEEDISAKYNIKFKDISAGKIRRYFDIKNFYEPLKNLTGIVEAIYFINKYKIDKVFSKGGYVSLPMAIGAKIMRKKLYIHESDTVGGISNKLVGKMADKIFYTFENSKIDNIKHIHSGQILNPELLDSIENVYVSENKRQKILVTGGSQGSTEIFEILLEILPELDFIDFTVILGDKNEHFRDKFDKFTYVKVLDFANQKDLGMILKSTDIAITRAGATSLWEQNVFGIHSIIIPLQNSAGDHQNKNALYFNGEFGSDILNSNETLSSELKNKLIRYKDLRKAGLNLDKFFDALKIIKDNMK